MSGTWFGRTPNSPSAPGQTTFSTSSLMTSRSGVTISRVNPMGMTPCSSRAMPSGPWPSRRLPRSRPPCRRPARAGQSCFPSTISLKPADGLLERHVLAGRSGELLRHEEGLREEPLDLPRAGDDELVVLGELVHAEDGDDVLEVLVFLENELDVAGDLVVLLADDLRVEDPRGGVERVDRRDRCPAPRSGARGRSWRPGARRWWPAPGRSGRRPARRWPAPR